MQHKLGCSESQPIISVNYDSSPQGRLAILSSLLLSSFSLLFVGSETASYFPHLGSETSPIPVTKSSLLTISCRDIFCSSLILGHPQSIGLSSFSSSQLTYIWKMKTNLSASEINFLLQEPALEPPAGIEPAFDGSFSPPRHVLIVATLATVLCTICITLRMISRGVYHKYEWDDCKPVFFSHRIFLLTSRVRHFGSGMGKSLMVSHSLRR